MRLPAAEQPEWLAVAAREARQCPAGSFTMHVERVRLLHNASRHYVAKDIANLIKHVQAYMQGEALLPCGLRRRLPCARSGQAAGACTQLCAGGSPCAAAGSRPLWMRVGLEERDRGSALEVLDKVVARLPEWVLAEVGAADASGSAAITE